MSTGLPIMSEAVGALKGTVLKASESKGERGWDCSNSTLIVCLTLCLSNTGWLKDRRLKRSGGWWKDVSTRVNGLFYKVYVVHTRQSDLLSEFLFHKKMAGEKGLSLLLLYIPWCHANIFSFSLLPYTLLFSPMFHDFFLWTASFPTFFI